VFACLVRRQLAHFSDLVDWEFALHEDIHDAQPERMAHDLHAFGGTLEFFQWYEILL
jgi:hypothetical protein